MIQENELQKLVIDDTNYLTKYTPKYLIRKPYTPCNKRIVKAVIPGIIQDILIAKGQQIKRNDNLIVLEAMKMKNNVVASCEGTVKAIHVKKGQMVAKGELLIEFE